MGRRRRSASTTVRATGMATSHSNLQQIASVTVRQKSIGKKESTVNAKSMLKLEHLKELAAWSSGEKSMASLGAFFGNRFAATSEALIVPSEPNLFSCERCESIRQPGYNCSVRIEKEKAKSRHKHKKSTLAVQNSVVYKCVFCSHRNVKRGTLKNYMKKKFLPKTESPHKVQQGVVTEAKCGVLTGSKDCYEKIQVVSAQELASNEPSFNSPSTTSMRKDILLLVSKTKKRSRSAVKKTAECGSSSGSIDVEKSGSLSSNRRRKSWASLKEIAERSDMDNTRSFANLKIPLII